MYVSLLDSNLASHNLNIKNLVHASYNEICQIFPKKVRKIFNNLDLKIDALAEVKKALLTDNYPAACQLLLAHYQKSTTANWLNQHINLGDKSTIEKADLILDDIFTFQLITGKVKRLSSGRLDWYCHGPNDDREWAWFLNRHYHLITLLNAYNLTGNKIYIDCLNTHLLDWILSSPSLRSPRDWAQWRGLEVAYRMLHWAPVFFGLQHVDSFTPVVRLLMISSIIDHARYLRYSHDWGDNWVHREMNGLTTVAVCLPELKRSHNWLSYATNCMTQALKQQVYLDGAHKELTVHYHRIVLRDLENFVGLLAHSKQGVSPSFKVGLESMWSYLAYTLRPDGYSLLNNDSDQEHLQQLLINAAASYRRPDWQYIATNGLRGSKPPGEASVVFPWSGQVVMRSDWTANAHWAFFDIGPLGINYHEHQDSLHLSLAAYGRDLLVDGGRYSYVRSRLWNYFRGSASHNVILIDGQGQKNKVREWKKPMEQNYRITSEFDFVHGYCDRGFSHLLGRATHSRTAIYLRGHYWIIVDQIFTDRPRTIEPLWHFHPDCTLAIQDDRVVSVDADVGNLGIIPVSDLAWQIDTVTGQHQPPQGWWSREYGHLSESPTAIFRTKILRSTIFAWILFPAKGQIPPIQVKKLASADSMIRIKVELPQHQLHEIVVQAHPAKTVQLTDGSKFKGKCAIVRSGQPPLVAYGALTHADGTIIAQHR